MEDNDDHVKPGFTFDMEIIVVDLQNANYAPTAAVLKDRGSSEYYVFVVDSNEKISKRTVEIGTIGDMYIEIVSGLAEGEIIMSNPNPSVTDGSLLSDYTTTVEVNNKAAADTSSNSILSGITGSGAQTMPSGGGMPSGGMPTGGGGGGMPGGRQ